VGHVVLDEVGRNRTAVEGERGRVVEPVTDDVGIEEAGVVALREVAQARRVVQGSALMYVSIQPRREKADSGTALYSGK
jgi:hypothetical protein